MRSPEDSALRWDAVTRCLHWLVALAIAYEMAVAAFISNPGDRTTLYASHESIGLLILAATAARILWRLRQPRPSWPAGMAGWQARAAMGVHCSLYALMLALPLSGWLYRSAAGFRVRWFGVDLPALGDVSFPSKALALQVHAMFAATLLTLVGLHGVAALKHHFIDRDFTLSRMLPGKGPS